MNIAKPEKIVLGLIAYCGKFYGQSDKGHAYPTGIGIAALLDIIRTLPAGTTDLPCHPAAALDMDSTYKEGRIDEQGIYAHHAGSRRFLRTR
jgi:hypothetical protein